MRLHGLTGGIASGKSTAAKLFRELGIPVIDADVLAREAVAPGQPALAEIAALWPDVLAADGTLNRVALAGHVFKDAAQRARLEAILHPRIRAEMVRRATAELAAGAPYVLYEAALIFETGGDRELDGTILVTASPETQSRRVADRDQLAPDEIARRLAAQLPTDEKRKRARWILENDGDLDALRAQIVALDRQLRAPRKVTP